MSPKTGTAGVFLWCLSASISAHAVIYNGMLFETYAQVDRYYTSLGSLDPWKDFTARAVHADGIATAFHADPILLVDATGLSLAGNGAVHIERTGGPEQISGLAAHSRLMIAFVPETNASYSVGQLNLTAGGTGASPSIRLVEVNGRTLFSFSGETVTSIQRGTLIADREYRLTVTAEVAFDSAGPASGDSAYNLRFDVREVTRPLRREIDIVNPGFEAPATLGTNLNSPPEHWERPQGIGGVWNINAFPSDRWDVPAPEGSQVLAIVGAPGLGVPSTFHQQLDESLGFDTIYRLTGWVGGMISSDYAVTIYAGEHPVGTLVGNAPLRSFESFRLDVNTQQLPLELIGQPLTIELTGIDGFTSFDDLRLVAIAIPEPTSGAIALVTFIAAIRPHRRCYWRTRHALIANRQPIHPSHNPHSRA